MEIIIDIPESLYENILICWENIHPKVWKILKDGTILPKGHGDLKDVDEIERLWQKGDYDSIVSALIFAPTIIEADKAESEVQDEIHSNI